MSSEISICSIYSGQMLWALMGSKYPYWPAIVCASPETGDIQNTRLARSPSIHVKFCGKRKSFWVHLKNVFEFNGYEFFVTKKQSMKSELSLAEFNKAFDTANNGEWRKAVVEATFVASKELSIRLIIFDLLGEINSGELGKIASSITFDDDVSKPPKVPQVGGGVTKKSSQQKTTSLPKVPSTPKAASAPIATKASGPQQVASESNVKGRRKSQPLRVIEQTQKASSRRSLPAKIEASKTLNIHAVYNDDEEFVKNIEEFERKLLTYEMPSYPEEILFQGTRNGNICKICCSISNGNSGMLVKCSDCGDHVHSVCLPNNSDESFVKLPEEQDSVVQQPKRSSIRIRVETKVLCNECSSPSVCFACDGVNAADELKKCDVRSCRRYYHSDCLDNWKQTELSDSKLRCPLHVCHACFSINNRSPVSTKFTFCVKCPTAYHRHSCCIPAGTIILTQKQHICIRHRCESISTIPKLEWCVRCGKGGDTLICCVSCPKAYHTSCLQSTEVTDPFLCESCSNGVNPLYGQMVVAKYGDHPWWPAVIVPTFKVPVNMYDGPVTDHEFCIRFFGDFRFGWIGRGSVLLYSKGDASKLLSDDQAQMDAFTGAAKWFDKRTIAERDLNNNEVINVERNVTPPNRQPSQYTKITTISIVAPAKLKKSEDDPCKCSCQPDDRCGPSSKCENREMSIECDPRHCPSPNCKNQCFQRNQSAAVKVAFINENKGFGLIADEFIGAGAFVIEYVGELITENELERRNARKKAGTDYFYFMTYSKGLYIDADRKGNESRFVNHSCNPNCRTQKWAVNNVNRIGYFALVDIKKGTELTINYGFGRGNVHRCFCGEKKCKGVIGNPN